MPTIQAIDLQSSSFLHQDLEVPAVQTVCCPNCGSPAERHYLATQQITQTQCPTCDYLMVMCSRTGNVREAYAPGLLPRRHI